MDISIKDLIVQTERPGSGLRGLASQSARGTASSASIGAFNDLLQNVNTITADPAPEKSAPAERPAPDDRASRSDAAARDQDASRADKAASRRDQADARSSADDDAAKDDETASAKRKAKHAAVAAVPDGKTDPNNATAQAVAAPAITVTTPAQADAQASAADAAAPIQTAAAIDPNAPRPGQSETASAAGTPSGKAGPAAKVATGNVPEAAAKPQLKFADLTQAAKPQAAAAPVPASAALTNADIASAVASAANGTTSTAKTGSAKTATVNAKPTDASAAASTPAADGKQAPAPAVSAPDVKVSVNTGTGSNAPAPHSPMTHGVLAAQEIGQDAAHGMSGGQDAGVKDPQLSAAHPAAAATPAPTHVHGAGANGVPPVPQSNVPPPAAAAAAPQTADVESAAAAAPRANAITAATPVGGPVSAAPTGQTTAATNTSQATAATRTQVPPAVPLDEVSVHIAKAAADGTDRITIKLKPAELGSIDVKLHLTHDGRVAAVISADRSDTLAMLRRDAQSLEHALADAGLQTDSGGLQFNLRGQGQGQNPFFAGHDAGFAGSIARTDTPAPAAPQALTGAIAGYANLRSASGGLDIRV